MSAGHTGADFVQRRLVEDCAIAVHHLHNIDITVRERQVSVNRLELTSEVVPIQRDTALLAHLAIIRDWVLGDADPASVDQDGAGLLSELVSVAVDLLQQRTTRAKDDIVGAVAIARMLPSSILIAM